MTGPGQHRPRICGPRLSGSGKTSFARKLSEQTGALCLSADDWYLRLYTDGHRPNTSTMSSTAAGDVPTR